MALDTSDKKYISSLFKRSHTQFRKEMKEEMSHQVGIVIDEFQDRLELVTELIDLRPTREEMNEKIDSLREAFRSHIADHALHG